MRYLLIAYLVILNGCASMGQGTDWSAFGDSVQRGMQAYQPAYRPAAYQPQSCNSYYIGSTLHTYCQ